MAVTETLFSSNMLNSHVGLVVATVIGYFFGFFLEKAGFGSSRKLTGIFYLRDMAVLKVMFTGVVTALVGYRYFVALGWIDPANIFPLDTYWQSQIVGGLLFGVGFVMGGWCPGTAFVGLASAKWDALVFLGGAGLGTILFNEVYPLVRGLYEGGHAGTLILPESIGITRRLFPLLFCLAAVGAFAGSTWLEQRFGGIKPPSEAMRNQRRAAAIALLVLAALLVFVRPPVTASVCDATPARPAGLLTEVDNAADHMSPEALADALMQDAQALFLIDIRPAEDFEQFHLPTARHIPLAALPGRVAELPGNRKIVLYSNGTTHAAQAWLWLRQQGFADVQVLTDGIVGFWRDCLTPPSLQGPIDEATAAPMAARFTARKAFFLPDPQN